MGTLVYCDGVHQYKACSNVLIASLPEQYTNRSHLEHSKITLYAQVVLSQTGSKLKWPTLAAVFSLNNCISICILQVTTNLQSSVPFKGAWYSSEEVRHASRNADSACPFLHWRDGKKGHAESAFRDACRTSYSYCSVVQWNALPLSVRRPQID